VSPQPSISAADVEVANHTWRAEGRTLEGLGAQAL